MRGATTGVGGVLMASAEGQKRKTGQKGQELGRAGTARTSFAEKGRCQQRGRSSSGTGSPDAPGPSATHPRRSLSLSSVGIASNASALPTGGGEVSMGINRGPARQARAISFRPACSPSPPLAPFMSPPLKSCHNGACHWSAPAATLPAPRPPRLPWRCGRPASLQATAAQI